MSVQIHLDGGPWDGAHLPPGSPCPRGLHPSDRDHRSLRFFLPEPVYHPKEDPPQPGSAPARLRRFVAYGRD